MNQTHFLKNFSLVIIALMSSSALQASFPNNETENLKKPQIKQEHVNNDYLVEIMEDDINPFEIKTEDEPDKNNIDFKQENMGNDDETEDNTINIIIDSFPKAFIEENGSHAHSGVHEKYWVPQKETIQTIIKSLKEEKTICANGKNYFLKPKDIDQGVAIHRILAEIYYASDKNDKKQFVRDNRNMVNALKRLKLKEPINARKKRTEEELQEMAKDRNEGATLEKIEKKHHIDSRTIQKISKTDTKIKIDTKRKKPEQRPKLKWDKRNLELLRQMIGEKKGNEEIARDIGTSRDEIKRKREIIKRNLSEDRKPLRWNEEMEDKLVEMKQEEKTNTVIAEFFTQNYGEITKEAISTKYSKLKKKRKIL